MIRPHSQRLQILELLNDLMLKHRAALKSLGDEVIVGITDLVSGEKDPRGLMIIFSVLHVIMVEWDIANQAEASKLYAVNLPCADLRSLSSTPFSAIFLSLSVRHRITHFT